MKPETHHIYPQSDDYECRTCKDSAKNRWKLVQVMPDMYEFQTACPNCGDRVMVYKHSTKVTCEFTGWRSS